MGRWVLCAWRADVVCHRLRCVDARRYNLRVVMSVASGNVGLVAGGGGCRALEMLRVSARPWEEE